MYPTEFPAQPAAKQALVLFGSPGSGKGTQAKLLKHCLNVPHISTGDMLREKIRTGADLEPEVAAVLKAGGLVSDAVVDTLVSARVSEPDCASGFILDGYPRTREQAEYLCKWLQQRGIREVVIHLVVDYNVIIARLTGRRQCPRCGSLYNLAFNPPKVAGVCDLDGESLVVRDDDSEQVIRERLAAYERQTQPLLEYFREKGKPLFEVDASRDTPESVAKRICGIVR